MNVRIAQARGEVIGLDEEAEVRWLARAPGRVRDYAAGEVIFGDGKPPRYMYVVLKGEVEVLSDESVVGTIHEGQALGNLSLLDVSPRLTAARAAGPCQLALLDEERFRALIEREPNFIVFVMQELGSRPNA
ncbi:MAG TPA: cyclic nucleotide-binding domain-containing protein [Roseiarcus sp.]|nr:cyclic nucleotide-binding domain-containing protein [Roseiarcus sp.]